MGMAAILFNGAEHPLDRRPVVKSGENYFRIYSASLEKTLKDSMILYMYIAQGQGQVTSRGQNFDFN